MDLNEFERILDKLNGFNQLCGVVAVLMQEKIDLTNAIPHEVVTEPHAETPVVEEWKTTEEAAIYLRVKDGKTVKRWAAIAEIEPFETPCSTPKNKKYRWRRTDLDLILERNGKSF